MKQNQFSTAIKFSLGALLLIFSITSCTKKTSEAGKLAIQEEYPTAKPGTVPEVYLKVTVRDAAGDKVKSDGGGDYIHGSQNVSARFDQYGNFLFNSVGPKPNRVTLRWFNCTFDDPIVVYITPPVTAENNRITGISTGNGKSMPIQNFAIGQSECIGFAGGPDVGEWRLNCSGDGQSSYMVITRISSTQWTLEPVGTCSPISNVGALRYGAGTLYGYYRVPFSFTLTSL